MRYCILSFFEWQRKKEEEEKTEVKPVVKQEVVAAPVKEEKRKLTYKEKREFEQIQQDIANLEKEKETITEKMNDGSLPFDQLQQLSVRISEITNLLDEKELRWLELSEFEA